MKARFGDQLVIESAEPGMPGRAGTIVAVRTQAGRSAHAGSLFGAGAAALRNIKRYIRMRQM